MSKIIECSVCKKKVEKKNSRAIYCSGACKQRAYEERKGIKAPDFIANPPQKKFTINRTPTPSYQFIRQVAQPAQSEYERLKIQKQNLIIKFNRIASTNFNSEHKIWMTVAGVAAGGYMTNANDSGMDLFVKLVGVPALFRWAGSGILNDMFLEEREQKKATQLERIKSDIQIIDQRINTLELTLRNSEIASNRIRKFDVTKKPKGIVSAEDYKKAIIPTLGFKEGYKYLMGDPSPGFYSVLTGSPGQGKSTFAVQFANYFQKEHGKVLFVAAEQRGINKPLQELLRRFKTNFDVETSPQTYDSKKWIDTAKNYDLVIIDSATNLELSPSQIEDIRSNASNTSFLVLLQSTKDGKYKGSTEWEHNCDIFMKADKMKIYQTKSRYAKPAHIIVEPY